MAIQARTPAGTGADAIVLWRSEPIPLAAVPRRIAELSGRAERNALYGAWREALDAVNPRYEQRLRARLAEGDPVERAAADGPDPRALLVDLERFLLHSETPYFAALRRYLALIDIEQGDATIADLWHVARGEVWAHWFAGREVARAASSVRAGANVSADEAGWRAAEAALAGEAATGVPARAAAAARASLTGSPAWLEDELHVSAAEIPSLVDFLALVRLWRLRHDIARVHHELRLYESPDDSALHRAYYAGIVGHMIGVEVPVEAYLADVWPPLASASAIETALLAAQLVEVLEGRFGGSWWRDPSASAFVDGFAAAASVRDALAHLGYDALDWRPVLRQIRTRLIGEMSGYGGPNITTRAGTRKV